MGYDELPGSLIAEVRAGRVVPFVGAGVSRGLRSRNGPLFPSWRELVLAAARELRNECHDRAALEVERRLARPDRYPAALELARQTLGAAQWDEFLRKQLAPPFDTVEPASLSAVDAMWRLRPPVVLTTNLDQVLEYACPERADSYDSTNAPELAHLSYLDWSVSSPTVWHLHGRIVNVASAVLTVPEYRQLYRRKGSSLTMALTGLLMRRKLLFVGFGFEDPFFLPTLTLFKQAFGGVLDHHFALIRGRDPKSERHREKITDRFGVRTIGFDDFDELSVLLGDLGERAGVAPTSGRPYLAPSPARAPQRLPLLVGEDDSILGRSQDVEKLVERLRVKKQRILTLFGEVGVGKTRLAIHLANELESRDGSRMAVVDLTDAQTVDGLCRRVAEQLEFQLGEKEPATHQVAGALRELRGSVVLDGVDQLVVEDLMPDLLATFDLWRRTAPEAFFLLTSRSRLPFGANFQVRPLPVPPPGETDVDTARSMDTVSLFVRARGQLDDFVLSASNVADVVGLCRGLEGVPGAIEWAARQTVLTPSQLVGRLSNKLELLGNPGGSQARSTSTIAALELAAEQLSENARAALAQTHLFRRGFTLDAAEHVVLSADGSPVFDLVATLEWSSFFRKSAVDGGYRFEHALAVRQFAERLWRDDSWAPCEFDGLSDRFVEYFVRRAECWAELVYTEGASALNALQNDAENVLAAHELALGRRQWDEATRLLAALLAMARLREASGLLLKRLTHALDITPTSEVESRVRVHLAIADVNLDGGWLREADNHLDEAFHDLVDREPDGAMLHCRGRVTALIDGPVTAEPILRRALDRFEADGDDVGRALAHLSLARLELPVAVRLASAGVARAIATSLSSEVLGMQARHIEAAVRNECGDPAAALELLDEAQEAASDLSLPRALWSIQLLRAETHVRVGQNATALAMLQELAEQARGRGNRQERALALAGYASALSEIRRDDPDIERTLRECLVLFEQVGDAWNTATTQRDLASTLLAAGRASEAVVYARRAHALFDDLEVLDTTPHGFLACAVHARAEFDTGHEASASSLARTAIGVYDEGRADSRCRMYRALLEDVTDRGSTQDRVHAS